MRNTSRKRFATIALALAVPFSALPAAQAAPTPESDTTPAGVDAEQWQQTLVQEAHDLENSTIPRHTVNHDGEDFIVYELSTGHELGIPASLTGPEPYLSAGPALLGPWLELTPTEQKVVAGGSIGFITAAICGGSFGLACGIASTIAGAALGYIGDKGVCSNNRRMLLELNWGGGIRGVSCR